MSDDSDICEIIAYLTRLKTDINSDIRPAINRGDPEGGYWSGIQLIFTNIELFGAFFSNKNTPATTVEFIKKYFKNPPYLKIPGILYTICRHGTVHQRKMKKFIVIDDQKKEHPFSIVVGKDIDLVIRSDSSRFYWSIEHGGDGQIYSHLELKTPDPSHPIAKDYPEIKLLPISMEQLFFDFNKAIDLYLSDLKESRELTEKAIRMKLKMSGFSKFYLDNDKIFEENNLLPPNHRQRRSYIQKTELDFFLK
ncbi:MAG: hypothetical protein LUO98_09980 [Methanoregula sp.]|nr:hypothetical protein [Methanoregula sp.]